MKNYSKAYYFEISSPKNNQTARSGILKIYDFPFSFDRYGVYFADPSYKNDKHPALSTEIPLFNYTSRQFDRGGFLYIYYENRNKKIRKNEYDIYSIYGSDRSVDKYQILNKTTGKFSGEYDPYINFKSNEVVWVAYSEYRWKKEFLEKTIKDKTQLKKRFQKLDIAQYTDKCKDYYRRGYQGWASADDPENSGYTSYYFYSLGTSYAMLNESSTTDENKITEPRLDDNPLLIYSFALHDPIGVADDIIAEIKDKMFEYKTFMDELQMPVVNEGEAEPSEKDIREYQALYQSASILKNLLFSDLAYKNKDLKAYRDKLNVNRINAVLGLQERKNKANEIRGYRHIGEIYSETGYRDGLRDSLGTLLFSNYYQSMMVDACNLEKNVKSAAKLRAVKHLEAMLIDPADIEIMYDPTYEAPVNKWKEKIAATIPSTDEKETTPEK